MYYMQNLVGMAQQNTKKLSITNWETVIAIWSPYSPMPTCCDLNTARFHFWKSKLFLFIHKKHLSLA